MNDETKDAEQWAQDWAADAEQAASRARLYSELAKRHSAEAGVLNRRSRRLSRVALAALAGMLFVQIMNLIFAFMQWRATR